MPTASSGGEHAAPKSDLHDDIPLVLGGNLRRLRTRQGHSLDRLAKLSGVSRTMLSQIETGKSVPTVSVLWKIATTLDVSIAALLEVKRESGIQIMPRALSKVLASPGGAFTSRALFPFDGSHKVEFYELTVAPLHTEPSAAHKAGTVENLVVAKGTVEIIVGKESPRVLSEGDAVVFDADVPHAYRNLTTTTAILYLVTSCREGNST